MGRELYEALAGTGEGLDGGEEISPLLRALATEARLRRAAADLAEAELMEGFWADETEASDGALRLAAEDMEDEEPLFFGHGYRLRLRFRLDGGARVLQEAGPGGLTIVLGEHWIPLQPGVPARLPQAVADAWAVAMPEALELMDVNGQRLRLSRRGY